MYMHSMQTHMFGFEDLPLSKVRKLAATHKRGSKACAWIGKLGNYGKHKSNMYRDLCRALKRVTGIEPTMIDVPMRLKKGGTVIKKWPVISICECLYCLHEKGLLDSFLLGDVKLSEWWQVMFKEPGFEALARDFAQADLDKLFPVRSHGDEGKWHLGKAIMVWSFSGLHHHNDVYLSRLLSTVMPATRYAYTKKKVQGLRKSRWMKVNITFRAVAKFFLWDLQAGQQGIFPDTPYVWSLDSVHVCSCDVALSPLCPLHCRCLASWCACA